MLQDEQVRKIVWSCYPACTEADPERPARPFRATAIIANPPSIAHCCVAEALQVHPVPQHTPKGFCCSASPCMPLQASLFVCIFASRCSMQCNSRQAHHSMPVLTLDQITRMSGLCGSICDPRLVTCNATCQAATSCGQPGCRATSLGQRAWMQVPLHMMFTMPWTPTKLFPHPMCVVQSVNVAGAPAMRVPCTPLHANNFAPSHSSCAGSPTAAERYLLV